MPNGLTCIVCGKEHNDNTNKCQRCNSILFNAIDPTMQEQADGFAQECRSEIASHLKSFCVLYKKYTPDETKTRLVSPSEHSALVIAENGYEILNQTKWTDAIFGKAGQVSKITISYAIADENIVLEGVEIDNIESGDFMRVGLCLDNDFNLKILLGDENSYKSKTVKLDKITGLKI